MTQASLLPGTRSKSGYFCPIAAELWAAPASPASLSTVVKPQNALPAFAMTNQVKVCMRQQFRYRFCNRRKILFNRILSAYGPKTGSA